MSTKKESEKTVKRFTQVIRVPLCGPSRKRIFKTHEAALMFAGGLPGDDIRRAYRCRFCAGWHLTSKD